MQAMAYAMGLDIGPHLGDVPFQRIKIKNKTRGLNIGFLHPRAGGDIKSDIKMLNLKMLNIFDGGHHSIPSD